MDKLSLEFRINAEVLVLGWKLDFMLMILWAKRENETG